MEERPDVFDFPTNFPLKAIGKNEDDFQEFVLSIIRKHVEETNILKVTSRLSHADKYLGVTITFVALSREHLDGIYRELSSHKRVLMLL